MIRSSRIEISGSALRNNIKFIKNMIGNDCVLSSVVKGNAYGHGIDVFVPLAEKCGVKHFSVFSAEEAERVWNATQKRCQILIMGLIDTSDLNWAIEQGISFFIFNFERLESALAISKRVKKKAKIHIELETGLNRTGFDKNELEKVLQLLKNNKSHFIIEGVCTHYAGAESIANFVRIQKQVKIFNKFCKEIHENKLKPLKRHTACSAAAITYPKTRMDMVRIGIMQYGYWPSKETMMGYLSKKRDKTDPLQRVITWKSKIMSMQLVKQGEFIGYGTTFMAENDMKIAVIPVGYAQGYSRSLSNHGRILIRGHRIGVVGIVNMNMLIADVSYLSEACIGDEVVLIGNQGDMSISVSSFSELSDQLNYELLTRLPQDTPRIIVK